MCVCVCVCVCVYQVLLLSLEDSCRNEYRWNMHGVSPGDGLHYLRSYSYMYMTAYGARSPLVVREFLGLMHSSDFICA